MTGPPLLRVLRGTLDPAETAALTAVIVVLLGAADGPGDPSGPAAHAPRWDQPDHHHTFRDPRAWGTR